MRKAINDNPMVQMVVIGVLLVGMGLFLATSVLKKKDAPPPAESSASALPTSGASTAAPTLGSATAPPPSAATTGVPPPTAESLVPGPGLPAAVVDAWESGDAIVLLIVRNKGVDDKLVRSSVQGLEGNSALAVFVAKAKGVARYSRITQGVGVNRVPALVIVRPKRLSGSVPEAQVSYGFRNSESVLQAVDNALYSGRDDIPYHPG